MNEQELQAQIDRLMRQFAANEPVELRSYLAAAAPNQVRLMGSTASAIMSSYVQTDSGLIVPQSAARAAIPLDQILKYLTAAELFPGLPVPDGFVERQLPRVGLDDVLIFVAMLVNPFRRPGAVRKDLDLEAIRLFLVPEVANRAANLLREKHTTFIVPQALFALAKYACLLSPLDPPTASGPPNLIAHMVLLAGELGPDEDEVSTSNVVTKTPGRLGREIVANQLFNSRRNDVDVMARFVGRWQDVPREHSDDPLMLDLVGAFKEATGVRLDDLNLIGAALWAAAMEGRFRHPPDYFTNLGWSEERTKAVLDLICIDSSGLAPLVQAEIDKFGPVWSISTFERYPLIRLTDGSFLVLDPALVVARIFGWLPLFDAKEGFKRRGEPGRAQSVQACLEHATEVYALQVLRRCVEGVATVRRLYDDTALEEAFGKRGRKKADAAIEYSDTWVVLEVTTSQPTRATVSGTSDEAIMKDLDKIIDEARQVEATISALKEDESRLTGHPARQRRRYFPVVVASEGFPVNPITITLLRERLAEEGILQSPDVTMVEVIDLEELEMLESIQEIGGPTLQELLEGKAASSLVNTGLRDYALLGLHLDLAPSARVRDVVERLMHELAAKKHEPP